MEDGISYEAEETMITYSVQFSRDDTEDDRQEDMHTIDLNHICVGTFIAESKESLALCAYTESPNH